MLPGHPPPSAVNVFFYAQQNPIIRVKTATPCQKSEFVRELPKTVSGKIRRVELRQREWAETKQP